MKLTTAERLLLQEIIPAQGDIITLKVLRKLREALSFSEAEIKELKFVYRISCPKCKAKMFSPVSVKCAVCDEMMLPDGNVRWDDSKEPNKDVFMGEKATDICRQALKDLNDKKKLEDKHVSLYDKFVSAPEKEDGA